MRVVPAVSSVICGLEELGAAGVVLFSQPCLHGPAVLFDGGERWVGPQLLIRLVNDSTWRTAFLKTEFAGGRHG
jgi:hypothetical protein